MSRAFTFRFFCLLGLMALCCLPQLAFAVDTKLATVTQNVGTNIATMPKLIAIVSYIIGTLYAVRGLFALKGFIDNPDENPVMKAVGFAATSALLIFLPFIVDVVIVTMSGGHPDSKLSSSSISFSATGE